MNSKFNRFELIKSAIDCLDRSYAPYSHFNVAAAVLASSGKIYTGVNVENASYPAGICAERNAIFHAVACGEREITAIAIIGGLNGQITDYCPPCGVCRQVMSEFCTGDFKILCAGEEEVKTFTLSELLPECFGSEVLK